MQIQPPESGKDEYVQLFVYSVPKEKRDSMLRLLKEIAGILRKHSTLRSEFFRLHSNEAFKGFATIASKFAAVPTEELWVELDYYEGRGHRDKVMADLSRDPDAGSLFRQLGPLVSEGYTIIMGEFVRMDL